MFFFVVFCSILVISYPQNPNLVQHIVTWPIKKTPSKEIPWDWGIPMTAKHECYTNILRGHIPPKIKIEPEHDFGRWCSFSTGVFSGSMLIFSGCKFKPLWEGQSTFNHPLKVMWWKAPFFFRMTFVWNHHQKHPIGQWEVQWLPDIFSLWLLIEKKQKHVSIPVSRKCRYCM